MLSKTISGDESSVKNATKFHIARCILHKVKIEKIVFVVFSLFSVCGNVTTWSAAHIVHYWCLPGVANLRGGTHTQEGEFSWTWHWAFWAFDLTSALAESTSCTFLHCGIFPSLIFFVSVSFVSSAPHILHYWWPRFVGNIGAGTRRGKERTPGPEVQQLLPSFSCRWTQYWGRNPLCISPENYNFHPLPSGNIGFPQFQIFNSCWWHICIFCLTWSFWCISYQNFREGWNFPNIGLLYFYLGTFASAFVFLAHLHLSGQHVVSAVALLASPSGRKQKVITRSYSCWQLW